MSAINATEARNSFQEMIDRVHYTKKQVVVTKHDKPWVVVKALPQGKEKIERLMKD